MAHPPTKPLGTPATYGKNTWVQTERKAHEAWAKLTTKSPRAGVLMHRLVARMEHQNAVVIAQKTLAKLMGCSTDTVQRAVRDLEANHWVQVVKLNGPGTVNAYVVNDRVAWGEKRDQMHRLSLFSAMVVADADDQSEQTLSHDALRRVPVIYPPEQALPTGDGEPGAQMSLPGMEPVVEGKSLPGNLPETVDGYAIIDDEMTDAEKRIIAAELRRTLDRMRRARDAGGDDEPTD